MIVEAQLVSFPCKMRYMRIPGFSFNYYNQQ